MHHQAGVDAPGADPTQFFCSDFPQPGVAGGPPVGLRIAQPQQPDLCGFRPKFNGYGTCLVPVLGVGHDLGIDELAKLCAPGMVEFCQVGVG